MSGLLTSCTTLPKTEVKNIPDVKMKIDANEVVIVSDVGGNCPKEFRKVFVDKLTSLTQLRNKKISVISYVEFVRSPYNNPKEKNSFPSTLFVFIKAYGGVMWSNVRYRMEVKRLDRQPLFIQEITLSLGHGLVDLTESRADELASTIFKELIARNIL
jgi:hypothetical protein